MHCPGCGVELDTDDARFCRNCGQALAHRDAPAAASVEPAAGARPSDAPPPAPHTTDPHTTDPQTPGPSGWPAYEPFPTAPPPSAPPPQSAWTSGDGPVSAFGAPLARWWQRVGSMLLDGIIIGVPYAVINAIIRGGSSSGGSGGSGGLWIVFLVLGAAYFTVLNGSGAGQTVGNRAPGIAIRDAATGEAIGPGRSFVRWLVRAVLYACFGLPGIVNDLFPLWDPRRQTIADKAARSVVIRIR